MNGENDANAGEGQPFAGADARGSGAGGRTLVMGIVNVTPDSFSERGAFASPKAAIDAALRLVDEGADIVDVGGESTRPGATALTAEQEWGRVAEVLAALAARGVVLSIDTYHAETARRSADLGVRIVNDVTGGTGDMQMHSTVAATDCMYVLQHSRGRSETASTYGDIGLEVASDLVSLRRLAVDAGIDQERIVLDPGFGFAKDSGQCWDLAADLGPVMGLGNPVLAGVSRKRFLAEVSPGTEPADRDVASAVVAFHLASLGVWAIRAHDAAATRAAVEAAARLRASGAGFARVQAPDGPAANAYEQASRLNRKPKGEGFRLRDLFGRGPGLNAGELWG